MATTGIWKIKSRLDNVIKYISNEEKTMSDGSYMELHNLKEYMDITKEHIIMLNDYLRAIDTKTYYGDETMDMREQRQKDYDFIFNRNN